MTTTSSPHRIRHVSRIALEQKQAAQAFIKGQSRITRTFLMMTALSTIIAAYGLLANSTAVVIGAMLLAPLMGPIFGIALGLSIGDLRLFRQALFAECLGVLLVVAIGYGIGMMPWRLEFGSEIVVRTQPTLFDLVIALASGLAGAYAMLDEKISSSITGVAIATALVPPLTTCGLCLASGSYAWALGAFVLFVANFLAIQLAGAIVFTGFGLQALRPETTHSISHLLRRFGLSIVLLLGVALFMWQTLHRLVVDDRLTHTLHQVLSRELSATTGAKLNELSFERRDGALQVMAVILTPQEFDAESVAHLEGDLRKEVDPTTHLIVRSLISKDADRQGQVFLPDTVLAHQAEAAKETGLLTQVSKELQRQFADISGARLIDLRREPGEHADVYTAVVRTPTPIEPTQIAQVQAALRAKVTPELRLIIRSVLTRDADAQQYLYQPKRTATAPDPTEIRRRQWLEHAVRNQLRQQVPGAALQEFRYAYRGGRLKMFAIVRSLETVSSAQVRKMQGMLRWYVDPTTELVIRSMVGADAGADGYVTSLDESQF
ncbi:MAG: TIGR00341 family protein [Armatimonadota bacterium]